MSPPVGLHPTGGLTPRRSPSYFFSRSEYKDSGHRGARRQRCCLRSWSQTCSVIGTQYSVLSAALFPSRHLPGHRAQLLHPTGGLTSCGSGLGFCRGADNPEPASAGRCRAWCLSRQSQLHRHCRHCRQKIASRSRWPHSRQWLKPDMAPLPRPHLISYGKLHAGSGPASVTISAVELPGALIGAIRRSCVMRPSGTTCSVARSPASGGLLTRREELNDVLELSNGSADRPRDQDFRVARRRP